MKKTIATLLGLASAFSAFGQGTVVVANNFGATIVPIKNIDGSNLTGGDFRVEVFVYDAAQPGGFGAQVGTTMSTISATGRFSLTGSQTVAGKAPGTIADLIVRAWDSTKPGGSSYDTAQVRGSSTPFKTDLLGGDPDGPEGPLLPITPKGMVTGTATGFQSFTLVPEPSTIALAALGVGALLIRRRK